MKADITIFDSRTIADRATFDKPHQYAEGVRDVIVNGRTVLRHGRVTGILPGSVLYGPAYR